MGDYDARIVTPKEAKKYDQQKPRMDLVPPEATLEIAKVLAFGAQKYGDNNWRNGMDWGRVIAAVERHIAAWKTGENLDKESGLMHLAHGACGLNFLITYQLRNIGKDDRWKK